MVEFADNPRHKRSKMELLTEKGRAAFRQARLNENLTIEEALGEIDAAKVSQARELLKQIREAVNKGQGQA